MYFQIDLLSKVILVQGWYEHWYKEHMAQCYIYFSQPDIAAKNR